MPAHRCSNGATWCVPWRPLSGTVTAKRVSWRGDQQPRSSGRTSEHRLPLARGKRSRHACACLTGAALPVPGRAYREEQLVLPSSRHGRRSRAPWFGDHQRGTFTSAASGGACGVPVELDSALDLVDLALGAPEDVRALFSQAPPELLIRTLRAVQDAATSPDDIASVLRTLQEVPRGALVGLAQVVQGAPMSAGAVVQLVQSTPGSLLLGLVPSGADLDPLGALLPLVQSAPPTILEGLVSTVQKAPPVTSGGPLSHLITLLQDVQGACLADLAQSLWSARDEQLADVARALQPNAWTVDPHHAAMLAQPLALLPMFPSSSSSPPPHPTLGQLSAMPLPLEDPLEAIRRLVNNGTGMEAAGGVMDNGSPTGLMRGVIDNGSAVEAVRSVIDGGAAMGVSAGVMDSGHAAEAVRGVMDNGTAMGGSVGVIDTGSAVEAVRGLVEAVDGLVEGGATVEAARALVEGTSPALLVGLHALAVLAAFPGAVAFEIAEGAVFGFSKGLVLAAGGKGLGAVLAFAVVRWSPLGAVVREQVLKWVEKAPPSVQNMTSGVESDGALFIVLARLSPLPSYINNYAIATLTSIEWALYFPATFVGALPQTASNVLTGSALSAVVASSSSALGGAFNGEAIAGGVDADLVGTVLSAVSVAAGVTLLSLLARYVLDQRADAQGDDANGS